MADTLVQLNREEVLRIYKAFSHLESLVYVLDKEKPRFPIPVLEDPRLGEATKLLDELLLGKRDRAYKLDQTTDAHYTTERRLEDDGR